MAADVKNTPQMAFGLALQRFQSAVWLTIVKTNANKITKDKVEVKNSVTNCRGWPSAEIMACR